MIKDKKAAAPKEPVTKKSNRKVKCMFTDPERLQLGQHLTEGMSEVERLDDDKKRTNKDFDAKITAEKAKLGVLKNNLTTGYEYRDVECIEVMDTPAPGRKTVTRADTKESWDEPMTYDEKNPPLPFPDPVKAPKPGEPLNAIDKAIEKAEQDKADKEAAAELEAEKNNPIPA